MTFSPIFWLELCRMHCRIYTALSKRGKRQGEKKRKRREMWKKQKRKRWRRRMKMKR
jgi:hypothetical protein